MLELELFQLLYLFIITIIVSLIAKQIKFPYTIALVLIGFLISVLNLPIKFVFNPEVIFFIFLPPLIFEGAYHMDFQELKRNIKPISAFAIFGVLLSTFFVGFLLNKFLGFPWHTAFLFGAIISPTDPISVLAIFKKVRVPKRLSVILEGESIFNDGVGIVLFRIILGLIATGTFSIINSISGFLASSVEGIVLGIAVGLLAVEIIKKVDDHLLELLITIIVAYGCFLLGDSFHISGIVAIAVAGLIIGDKKTKIMKPSAQISIFTFWEFAVFIVNSLIFLLIGLKLRIGTFISNFSLILAVSLIVLLSRFLSVYLLSGILNRFNQKITKKWKFVISMGGLRGSIPIALALSLPITFEYYDIFASVIFGVVVISIVFGGLSLIPIIDKLKLRKRADIEFEYEYNVGKIIGYRSSLEELERLLNSGRISKKVFENIKSNYIKKLKETEVKVDDLFLKEENINKNQSLIIMRSLLLSQKSAIKEAEINGLISIKISRQLINDIDTKLSEIEIKLEELL
ncbi:MAG: Na+/H+ antiporter [Candidatus Aenigmarchaeota archaeon CG_4_10_14_3_um_filter_37_21]|nr:MAG: Na+/H+ antiporter [Candidatus Aenigmarchaeota archaeon CG_4_10_14_3_um_filter_37_21]